MIPSLGDNITFTICLFSNTYLYGLLTDHPFLQGNLAVEAVRRPLMVVWRCGPSKALPSSPNSNRVPKARCLVWVGCPRHLQALRWSATPNLTLARPAIRSRTQGRNTSNCNNQGEKGFLIHFLFLFFMFNAGFSYLRGDK